jgi:hypothetical protein
MAVPELGPLVFHGSTFRALRAPLVVVERERCEVTR